MEVVGVACEIQMWRTRLKSMVSMSGGASRVHELWEHVTEKPRIGQEGISLALDCDTRMGVKPNLRSFLLRLSLGSVINLPIA